MEVVKEMANQLKNVIKKYNEDVQYTSYIENDDARFI